ncbi:hypothetical protein DM860_014570 [Cuscuta australis]|uniref:Non-specific lipid-transfer protein n=1 Tax=Cuscuta australis TaxID=267555 RepID=A0A328DIW0_9ASTE|nr:hypothetical protein DM860_014570 [Cuscuta australis]
MMVAGSPRPTAATPSIPAALCAILLVLTAAPSRAAITCATVITLMQPCALYLTGGGSSSPPVMCCAGFRSLAGIISSPADKKTACQCLKDASKQVKYDLDRAKKLPGDCNVNFPIPLSPDVDCSKVI